MHLAERLLGSYCARICPPTARHAAQLAYELEGDRVTMFELRLFCGVPGATRRVPFAQLRFRAARNEWHLFYADAGLRWRRYRLLPASTSLVALLREIDADPARLFWPHVNGYSLRWCSTRGRCDECDLRYCAVLGLARAMHAQDTGS